MPKGIKNLINDKVLKLLLDKSNIFKSLSSIFSNIGKMLSSDRTPFDKYNPCKTLNSYLFFFSSFFLNIK